MFARHPSRHRAHRRPLRTDGLTPDGTVLTNTATVSTVTPLDPDSALTDDADVETDTAADLSLVKTRASATVVAGVTTTYRLAVRNHGPSDASGPITVVDDLPADFRFVSADNGWTCDPADAPRIRCTLPGPLLAGADAPVLTMVVQVDGDAELGTHTNAATVTSPTPDPDSTNDDDTSDVVVDRVADVSVVKSHTGQVAIGEERTFTLNVTNEGSSSARDVTVVDELPEGLELVSVDGGSAWSCTGTDGTVRCEHQGRLAPETDAAAITVVVRVLTDAYPRVENTATVTSSTPDDNPVNDTATDEVEVPPLADLTLAKSLEGELVVGEPGRYLLRVRNDGPTEVPGTVTVTDTLPAGLAFAAGTGPGWTCDAAGQVVTCAKDGLAADADEMIELVVDVLAGAYPEVVNTASVTSDATDPEPGNNDDEVTAPVTPTVVLSLEKSLVEQTGGRALWRLEVTNAGPSDTVAPVVVSDLLPKALTFVSASGKGFSCAVVGQLVTCTHEGVVPAGASVAVELLTSVVAQPGEQVRNTASVTGGTQVDPPTDGSSAEVLVPTVDGELPNTGGPARGLAPLGLLLLVLGAAALWFGRQRATV